MTKECCAKLVFNIYGKWIVWGLAALSKCLTSVLNHRRFTLPPRPSPPSPASPYFPSSTTTTTTTTIIFNPRCIYVISKGLKWVYKLYIHIKKIKMHRCTYNAYEMYYTNVKSPYKKLDWWCDGCVERYPKNFNYFDIKSKINR